MASKRITYEEINYTKEVQILFYRNYKTLLKYSKEQFNKLKDISLIVTGILPRCRTLQIDPPV